MRKSPLSTPADSTGKYSYKWKSNGRTRTAGYNNADSDTYECITPNTTSGKIQSGSDFIPLSMSSPSSEQNRCNGNWHSSGGRNHRNSGSGGFNHYRNNYHATPKSNFNNSYSPYKHPGKQFHGQRKGYQRGARRQTDISRYVDMKSFLEDPWAELTKKLNESKESDSGVTVKVEPLNYIDPKSDFESESVNAVDSSFSSDCLNESSINATLGLDDTDVSNVSKTDSSIDLKLDSVRFSLESKNDSICSNNDSASRDLSNAENIQDTCVSKTNVMEDLI